MHVKCLASSNVLIRVNQHYHTEETKTIIFLFQDWYKSTHRQKQYICNPGEASSNLTHVQTTPYTHC